ncbi:MAG TPA: NAD-dependent epimerase/dehydratase family protein [Acidimicrobiales bacterium]|nr:NAD-dependent epimerase/dehydratase family protein [Acidimicrobiales bacterium]
MPSVVISGATGRTGRRLLDRLARHPGVSRVVTVDASAPVATLKAAFEGIDVLVHLGYATAVPSVLEAAASSSISTVVYRSSASVYGAWPDNRVPLTEDVVLRPNPGFTFAVEHAEAERLVAEWAEDHPSVRVAVLRPVPVVAPGRESWESDTLGRPSSLRRSESLPPVQFLHVDDAAAAFLHAVLTPEVVGTYNVAPDGFVSGETARALATNGRLTLPLPDKVAAVAERWAWRLGRGGAPAPAVPYLVHPWVVADDKLTASGWRALHTNEEALVAARKGSWWRELSPKRRQELALSAAGGVGMVAAAVTVLAVRGARRRAAGAVREVSPSVSRRG